MINYIKDKILVLAALYPCVDITPLDNDWSMLV